jgi:regulatory protein
MGRITAIEPQKRNPQRVSIFVDGQFRLGLFRVTAGWLQVGQEVSDEKLAQLEAEDGREAGYQQALRFLEPRVRSQAEVIRNLQRHDYPESVITEVIERLKRARLVPDASFAQNWVENRSEFRPRGRRLLAMELRQRGLSAEAIAEATAELDEDDLAYQAGLKQARKLRGLDRVAFRQKLWSFLARRGFGYDVAAPVVDRIWNEAHTQDDS